MAADSRPVPEWIDLLPAVRLALAAVGSFSAFFHERFRVEFRPAVDAWIKQKPLLNPNSPPTPFDLPEYQLARVALFASVVLLLVQPIEIRGFARCG